MRIRRKKHLQERIEELKSLLIVADYNFPDVRLAVQNKKYFDFNSLFFNDNPVEMEIGCGKGAFVSAKAKESPCINYFAVELIDNVIVSAAELVKNNGLSNVRFFNCGADYLPRYVKPNSVSKIYLNFSPPFSGKRYENRRLTKPELVADYRSFLADNGSLELKTDDNDFFDYSKETLNNGGFAVSDLTEKLFSGEVKSTVTEYEEKFRKENKKIYYLSAEKI